MPYLTLVRHARTAATESAAFPLDDDILTPPDPWTGDKPSRVLASPTTRAQATARALGFEPETEPLLNECDFGTWRGHTFAELNETNPRDLLQWLQDPNSAPHGGESLSQLADRVRRFLDSAKGQDTLAVTHGGFIKVAVVVALDAPLQSMWLVQVEPLSATTLVDSHGTWEVAHVNKEI